MKGYWVALYKKINAIENFKRLFDESNSCHKKFWWKATG